MKFEIEEWGIQVIPETAQDRVYLKSLGVNEEAGDTIVAEVVRGVGGVGEYYVELRAARGPDNGGGG